MAISLVLLALPEQSLHLPGYDGQILWVGLALIVTETCLTTEKNDDNAKNCTVKYVWKMYFVAQRSIDLCRIIQAKVCFQILEKNIPAAEKQGNKLRAPSHQRASDGWTNRRTDGLTNGPTKLLIESLARD